MRWLLIGATVVFTSVGELLAERPKEMRAAVNFFSPKDDAWEKGVGVEGQVLLWQSMDVAVAAGLGVSKWDLEDLVLGEYDPILGAGIGVAAEGDAQVIPIGASVIYAPKMESNLDLKLEAGFRYMIVDSDIEVAVAATDLFNSVVAVDEIDLGDGFVGRVAADLSWATSDRSSFFAGIGYQFDLSKGDIKAFGETIGENELAAFYVQVGMVFDILPEVATVRLEPTYLKPSLKASNGKPAGAEPANQRLPMSLEEKLLEMKRLHAQGLLTDSEYDQIRKSIIRKATE